MKNLIYSIFYCALWYRHVQPSSLFTITYQTTKTFLMAQHMEHKILLTYNTNPQTCKILQECKHNHSLPKQTWACITHLYNTRDVWCQIWKNWIQPPHSKDPNMENCVHIRANFKFTYLRLS